MKHFNIDALAKTLFEQHILSPNTDTWHKLSEKLHHEEQKKKLKKLQVKVVSALIALFLGFGFTYDTNHRLDITTFINSENTDNDGLEYGFYRYQNTVMSSDIALVATKLKSTDVVPKEKGDITETKKKRVSSMSTTDKEQKTGVTKSPQKSSTLFNKFTKNSVKSVTNAEIDSLLEKAKENIQRDKALLKARQTFAYEILADVEEQMEQPDNKKLYKNLKQGFVKLRNAMAN